MVLETYVKSGAVGGHLAIAGFDDERAWLILRDFEPGLTCKQLDSAHLAVECDPYTAVGVEHDG